MVNCNKLKNVLSVSSSGYTAPTALVIRQAVEQIGTNVFLFNVFKRFLFYFIFHVFTFFKVFYFFQNVFTSMLKGTFTAVQFCRYLHSFTCCCFPNWRNPHEILRKFELFKDIQCHRFSCKSKAHMYSY